ncbi:hypothetical protein Tco_1398772 [Tanacetum coccineum]
MSDMCTIRITYTSVSEDDLDMGSPGIEVPIFEVPPSPDYIPGPEGPPSPDYVPGRRSTEAGTPSPIYIPFVPELVYSEFLTRVEDERRHDVEYLEEDPADYPADRGDDDDDAEDEHLAPAEPADVAYSADQDPYIAYRVTARMLCRTTPGPRCEVGESSAAGAARQFGPTTAEADLYGFADMLEAAPGRRMSRELGYGIRDTWDDLVRAISED